MGEASLPEVPLEDPREWQAERLRLLWKRRRFFLRAGTLGLIASTVVAFLIPKSYTSTTQLMPPDPQSTSGMAMMAAMAAKAGGGLAGVAGALLGLKSSGALFIGVLRSQTSQDRLIEQFDLRKVYGKRLIVDARAKLDENTSISEDRKSGIISISMTDHDPQRAAALANAYVDQLNLLIAEQSQLEGLRQIYTDNNSRVRSMSARVAELRRQLEKLGGTQNITDKKPKASTLAKSQAADP